MKKIRSYINLTKVFLNPLNVSLKGFIIRVKYQSLKTTQRKHGGVMKELIGKIHNTASSLPKKLVIEKKEITETKDIGEQFGNCFSNVGPKLAKNQFQILQTHSLVS